MKKTKLDRVEKKFKVCALKFSTTILLLLLFLSAPRLISADTGDSKSLDVYSCSYPCKMLFEITAYYSPMPNQPIYSTSTYEGDIRLNGEGVHSADGTKVYPGMIAAPKIFPFGAKMYIQDFGFTTVHDRGGAIVAANPEKGLKYNRLDIWVGEGLEGLLRAWKWGKQIKEVTIYGIDESIKDDVNFAIITESEKNRILNKYSPKDHLFTFDLDFGIQHKIVENLQEQLEKLNYLKKPYTKSVYDLQTQKAIRDFQVKNKIIKSENDYGAGYFGEKTRYTFENAIQSFTKHKLSALCCNTKKGDSGEHVRIIQENLSELNYLDEISISGIYDDKTIQAVFQFQKDNTILAHENDPAAGYFGPKTREKLKEKILAMGAKSISQEKKLIAEKQLSENILDKHQDLHIQLPYFSKDLKYGDKGQEVRNLQEFLRKLGYFTINSSGYYGEITEHAVRKFQASQQLINDQYNLGSGMLGPKTRQRLNSLIDKDISIKRFIAMKREEELEMDQGKKLIALK